MGKNSNYKFYSYLNLLQNFKSLFVYFFNDFYCSGLDQVI